MSEANELRRVIRAFHEYMGWANADEHLPDYGFDYFERVGKVGRGEIGPHDVLSPIEQDTKEWRQKSARLDDPRRPEGREGG